jgi:hypothetical protein
MVNLMLFNKITLISSKVKDNVYVFGEAETGSAGRQPFKE